MTACRVDGCEIKCWARGLCNTHYKMEHRRYYRSPNDTEVKSRAQAKLRAQVIAKLGGKCRRCGFNDPRALQIDHKDSSGAEHRKVVGWHHRYQEIIRYDTDFQLLCANCNWIMRAERREAIGRPRKNVIITPEVL